MTISPAAYFEQEVPQQYAAALDAASDGVLDQPALRATYVIDMGAEPSLSYGLFAEGRELTVVPGGIEDSDMVVRQSYETWRKSVESGALEMVVDYIERRKVAVIKGLKGTVTLELTDSEGESHETIVVFGGESEPAVTLQMTADDYRAMNSGELNGNMAFMMGKLKFEGSLPLLMQVGALSG